MRTNNDFNFIKKEEHNMSKDRTPHPNKEKGPNKNPETTTKFATFYPGTGGKKRKINEMQL